MLKLDGVTRRYGETVALDGLSFEVNSGEVVGFLGPNGAGKTTAMRAVFGLVQLDSGSVSWQGAGVNLDVRRRFGYMPEERGLYAASPVAEQLVFLAQLHGCKRDRATKSAHDLLERFDLADRATDRLDALSLGNQQRVQLAAALVHEPELLVLDEPFSGLDPTGIETMSDVVKQKAADGVGVVFSSHQLDLVESVCERVVIINKGRLVTSGRTKDLTTSSGTLAVGVSGDPEGSWAHQMAGVTVESIDDSLVRLTLGPSTTSDMVLDTARQAGSVTHFAFVQRRLSEVFREAIAQ